MCDKDHILHVEIGMKHALVEDTHTHTDTDRAARCGSMLGVSYGGVDVCVFFSKQQEGVC